jgi:hypothetical protein
MAILVTMANSHHHAQDGYWSLDPAAVHLHPRADHSKTNWPWQSPTQIQMRYGDGARERKLRMRMEMPLKMKMPMRIEMPMRREMPVRREMLNRLEMSKRLEIPGRLETRKPLEMRERLAMLSRGTLSPLETPTEMPQWWR